MVLSLTLLALAIQASQPSAGTVREHIQRGYTLAGSGNLVGAEAELREAVRLAPKEALPLAALGAILSRQGKLQEASQYLKRALELNPRDTASRLNLALNQFRLGDVEAAKANVDRVLAEARGDKQAASLLAAIRSKQTWDTAWTHYQAGRFRASQSVLEQMIAGGNREPRVMSLLAVCQQRQNHREEALATLHRAIGLAPGDAGLYSTAARFLFEDGNAKAAGASASKALELDPANTQALKIKGIVDLQNGDPRQALPAFERAVNLDRSDPEALVWLGTAQQALFQYAEARNTFEKGIARFPAYARLYEAYGKLLLDPGSDPGENTDSRAAALLRKALALDASLPQTHYELGKLLIDGGKTPEAVHHLEASVKLDPRDPAAHLALAEAYRILGRASDQARELAAYRDLAQPHQ